MVGTRVHGGIEEQVQAVVRYPEGAWVNFYHGFHQATRMDRQVAKLVFEHGDVVMQDWVPTRVAVHAIVDETQNRHLCRLFPGLRWTSRLVTARATGFATAGTRRSTPIRWSSCTTATATTSPTGTGGCCGRCWPISSRGSPTMRISGGSPRPMGGMRWWWLGRRIGWLGPSGRISLGEFCLSLFGWFGWLVTRPRSVDPSAPPGRGPARPASRSGSGTRPARRSSPRTSGVSACRTRLPRRPSG